MKRIALVLAVVVSTSAFAARAIWTGRIEQAESVSGRIGWKCEYDLFGNTFWRFSKTAACPSSIEVE